MTLAGMSHFAGIEDFSSAERLFVKSAGLVPTRVRDGHHSAESALMEAIDALFPGACALVVRKKTHLSVSEHIFSSFSWWLWWVALQDVHLTLAVFARGFDPRRNHQRLCGKGVPRLKYEATSSPSRKDGGAAVILLKKHGQSWCASPFLLFLPKVFPLLFFSQ